MDLQFKNLLSILIDNYYLKRFQKEEISMGYKNIHAYQEIEISSIDEIYSIIEQYKKFHKIAHSATNRETSCLNVFYRGQSNSCWDITPSLLRSQIKESDLIKMFQPSQNLSLFGMIAYIQHYHEKTRFIDFTLNPDVALYFACSENYDKDGSFYIYPYVPHKAEWYTSIVLSELVQIPCANEIAVQDFSCQILDRYPNFKNQFSSIESLNSAIMAFLDHGFMVLPDKDSYLNNPRLNAQKGCFYICGVKFTKNLDSTDRWATRAGSNKFEPHSAIVPDNLKNGHELVKLIIPRTYKMEIIKYLATKGDVCSK